MDSDVPSKNSAKRLSLLSLALQKLSNCKHAQVIVKDSQLSLYNDDPVSTQVVFHQWTRQVDENAYNYLNRLNRPETICDYHQNLKRYYEMTKASPALWRQFKVFYQNHIPMPPRSSSTSNFLENVRQVLVNILNWLFPKKLPHSPPTRSAAQHEELACKKNSRDFIKPNGDADEYINLSDQKDHPRWIEWGARSLPGKARIGFLFTLGNLREDYVLRKNLATSELERRIMRKDFHREILLLLFHCWWLALFQIVYSLYKFISPLLNHRWFRRIAFLILKLYL